MKVIKLDDFRKDKSLKLNVSPIIFHGFEFIKKYLLVEDVSNIYLESIRSFSRYSSDISNAVCEFTFNPDEIYYKFVHFPIKEKNFSVTFYEKAKLELQDLVSIYDTYSSLENSIIPNLNEQEAFDWATHLYFEQFLYAISNQKTNPCWNFPKGLKITNHKDADPTIKEILSKGLDRLVFTDFGVTRYSK